MVKKYTIDELRSYGEPTWFGLGFIQLKMDELNRFHFWHPDLPKTTAYDDEWHDHRYDFNSSVIVGSITNELATWIPHEFGYFNRWEVCCAGTGVEYKEPVALIPIGSFTTKAGDSYFLNDDTLHKTKADLCMTLQKRSYPIGFNGKPSQLKIKANVVAKEFKSPSPFEQNLSTDFMWEIIEDIVGKAGYHLSKIEKGVLGEVSKIKEEVDELIDAVQQNARIMELVEMSDLIGAIDAYLMKHHAGYSYDDLKTMSEITKRAFLNGFRS